MDYKFTGIILEKYDVSESDRAYGIYTQEEGRIRVIGKGVRKAGAKLAGFLEPITFGEFFIAKNKGTGKVTGAIIHNNFEKIKNNYLATEKVFEAMRIFCKIIIGHEQDNKIFDLLNGYLEEMERNSVDEWTDDKHKFEIITLGFKHKLLEISGYMVNVDRCAVCHEKLRPGKNYFSVERGSMVCAKCSGSIGRKIIVSDNTIKILRLLMSNDIRNYHKIIASEKDIRNIKMVIKEEVSWILT